MRFVNHDNFHPIGSVRRSSQRPPRTHERHLRDIDTHFLGQITSLLSLVGRASARSWVRLPQKALPSYSGIHHACICNARLACERHRDRYPDTPFSTLPVTVCALLIATDKCHSGLLALGHTYTVHTRKRAHEHTYIHTRVHTHTQVPPGTVTHMHAPHDLHTHNTEALTDKVCIQADTCFSQTSGARTMETRTTRVAARIRFTQLTRPGTDTV